MTKVELWVVYKHPDDYPDKFVARKWVLDKPTDDIKIGNTLEEVRTLLPHGLTHINRAFLDDIVIAEIWL